MCVCVCVCVCVCGFILNNCQHRWRRSEIPGTLETPLWVTNDIMEKKKSRKENLDRGKVCSFYLVNVTPCCLLQTKIVSLLKKCDVFSKFKSSLVRVCWKIYTDEKMFNVTS